MKSFISSTFLIVLILCISLNEASNKNKHNDHNKKKPHEDSSSIDLCPLVKRIDCRRAPGNVVNECETDNDCKTKEPKSPNSRCCQSSCGDRLCTKPVKVSTKNKAGSCPIATFDPLIMCGMIDPSLYECRQDSECPGNKKCCAEGPCAVKKCKDHIEERQGKCPDFKYDHSVIQNCKPFSEANFECKKDADCKVANQKCCLNSCRILTCQNSTQAKTHPKPHHPATVKPEQKQNEKNGYCPIATFDPLLQCTPVDPKFWDCRQDSECPGTQKCCESGPCGVKTCKNFVNVRKGVCPEFKFDMQVIRNCPKFTNSSSECSQDSECKTNMNQKCCLNKCRVLTCQNPIAKKADDDKKGPKIHVQPINPKKDEKKEPKKDEKKGDKKDEKKGDKKEDSKGKPTSETKADKAGSCPVSTFDPLIQCMPVDSKFWDCRQDSECSGTQKCCEDGPCGVKKCKNAVEERKGKCPVHKYDHSVIQKCALFSEANFDCRVDADCKQNANFKCCRDPCFLLKCQAPVA